MAQIKKQAADSGLKYRKEELLLADSLKPYRDVAEAVLLPGVEYTLEEAEAEVNKFLKGKVK